MVNMTPLSHFISCDWGTSHFRLRLINRANTTVLAHYASDHGIQSLAMVHPQLDERRAAMTRILRTGISSLEISDQPEIPVVISGMASSTLGWQSLPYASLPAPINGSTLEYLDFTIDERQVRLISGLHSANDVMRGEETELIGLFTGLNPAIADTDCVVILPGTHSKHVRVRNGTIVDFTTHLTGEIFKLLNERSTLRATGESQFDTAAFRKGVRASHNLGMSAALFRTRSLPLLDELAPTHSSAFLSGVLIGAEIATLTDDPASRIILAAGAQLTEQYYLAINTLIPDATLTQISADDMATVAIRGHAAMLNHP